MRINVIVRWLIRRDMPEVMAIENQALSGAWSKDDIVTELTGRRTLGMVAEKGDRILGYMIYELCRSSLLVVKFAVDEDHRREGIGTQMFDTLVVKIEQQKRTSLEAFVHECDLGAQNFCKAMGFKATGITEPSDDDGRCDYKMVYRKPSRSKVSEKLEGRLVECEE